MATTSVPHHQFKLAKVRYKTTHSTHIPLHHLPKSTFTVVRKDNLGYHFNTSITTCNITTYADDLAIITNNLTNMQPQIPNYKNLSERTHLDLNLTKCAITRSPNKSKLEPNVFKAYIQVQNIILRLSPSPSFPKRSFHIHGYTFHPLTQMESTKRHNNGKKKNKANNS